MAKRGVCEKRELMMRSSCGLSCGFCSEKREFDGNLLGHFFGISHPVPMPVLYRSPYYLIFFLLDTFRVTKKTLHW